MIRRLVAYAALGVVAGALLTVTAGLGFAVHDWQHANRAARRTATAYGRGTR